MLRIRLSRHGAKKDPHYRVVVSEKSSPRDGRFVEVVGYYNPALQPVRLNLKLDRVDYWLGRGARPSETVRALIRRVRTEAPPETQAEPEQQAQEQPGPEA